MAMQCDPVQHGCNGRPWFCLCFARSWFAPHRALRGQSPPLTAHTGPPFFIHMTTLTRHDPMIQDGCLTSAEVLFASQVPPVVIGVRLIGADKGLTVLLHDREGLDDDLGRRADKHLALAAALGVDNVVL